MNINPDSNGRASGNPGTPDADPAQQPIPRGPHHPASADPGSGTGPLDPGSDPAADAGGEDQQGGESYADAVNQVGGEQLFEQNREHDRALADLQGNQIGGDVFFGDKFELSFGHGGVRIRVRRITAEELTEPFVRSAPLEQLAASVTDQPLVVLQGPKGYGKSAALLRILRRNLRDGAGMFFLDPSTDLLQFSCVEVPEHSVLILQDLPDRAADRLDSYAVGRLQEELRVRSCRLGITTGKAVNLAAVSADFLVLELAERPSPRQVFGRHLSELFLGTGISRDDVLEWPEVNALLDIQLGPQCSLADAARLAAMLFRARGEPQTAAARVRAQMTEYSDEKVAQWFRKLDSLKAQCMAISLAVLNGLSREVIAREAQLLESRILPPPDASNAPPLTNPFSPEAAVSPELLQARVISESRMTAHGPVAFRAMYYLEQGYPGQVLRYVWRERDDGRAALVDWLRHLGKSPDLAVRVRAATAVGVLACEAMDYLHRQVILGWASDGDAGTRTSAAIALGPPARDPVVGDTVRSVVADWAKEGTARTVRATAARTYGRSIGMKSPTLAMRELARMAEVDDLMLRIAVCNSYCELVLDGTAPLSVRVLSEIEKLAADRNREKQITGRLSLLGLSHLRGAPPALSEQGSRFRRWPTLLVLCLASHRFSTTAARLWQLSISDPDVGALVTLSLDDWALAAEDVGELRSALVRFMHRVASDERARRALVRRAQLWTGRNGKAPKTGQLLIEELT